jgi:hypothetical protein
MTVDFLDLAPIRDLSTGEDDCFTSGIRLRFGDNGDCQDKADKR